MAIVGIGAGVIGKAIGGAIKGGKAGKAGKGGGAQAQQPPNPMQMLSQMINMMKGGMDGSGGC